MSGASNLAFGSWAEAQAMVGTTLAEVRGADPVSGADIRRQLEVLGWDCPLHYDADFAKQYGYRDIASPVSMARVWSMPAYWKPGEPRLVDETLTTPLAVTKVPGEGAAIIATSVRMDYVEPVYPGDEIVATAVLKSVTPKQTRVGPGAYLVVETTYRNQHGQAVAIENVTVLRYQEDGEAQS